MARINIIKYGVAIVLMAFIFMGLIYSIQMTKSSSPEIEWAFTQEDQAPEKLLIHVIRSAQSTLDVAIFSLTHPDIVQAIKEAHERGIAVRLITDKESALNEEAQIKALNILGHAGIVIKVNKHDGLMHLKSVIADGKVVTTGSFNFSKSATTVNDEILIVHRDEVFAGAFSATFERMWNNNSKFEILEVSSF